MNQKLCSSCIFQWNCENSQSNQCLLEDIRVKDKAVKRLNKKKEKKMKSKKYEFEE